ncbi:MAG TPA: DUF3667 domain-containing protein [Longimicrobiales bacterium]
MATASFCPNCYQPNPGEYCPQCGQKQAERRVTLRALFSEFLDEQFGVNRRLPKTLRLLLFKPGFLTSEYFDGRVQQYLPPLRLYLLTSLVFFALFIVSDSNVDMQQQRREFQEQLQRDTVLRRRIEMGRQRGPVIGIRIDPTDTANWLANPDVNLGIPALDRAAANRIRQFAVFGEVEGTRRLVRAVIAEMPKVFFLLLPLYAFLLWLFFRRQRRYYVEHFIMGLHLHSFGFLVLIPAAFLDLPFMPEVVSNAGDFLSGFVLLWIVVYIFLALRRVYRQGRVRTGIKYFFLWILYSVFFVVGIILSGVLALAFTSS